MSRNDLLERLARASAGRAVAGLRRQLQCVDFGPAMRVTRDGRELVVFCSNDYLGMARDRRLIAALRKAAADAGVGSGSAHLVAGHHREHAALEEAVAEWTGRERALLFSTGMMANAGVLQALLGWSDLCVQDRLNHASLIDGAHLSGACLRRYPHADVDGAERHLRSAPDRAAVLATDGVFSMDGDVAPLRALAHLARREGATLMVDDAHGFGVLGPDGAGSVAAAGLGQEDVPILMVTLGKALGCFGACVAGPAVLIEGLIQFARSYIYTSAMPPALAAAAQVAVGLARRADDRRQRLARNIRRLRAGAAQLGLPMRASETAIQPLHAGSPERACRMAGTLEQAGFLVTAIRPPTVPRGQSRLRITLSAAHTSEEIDRLLDALAHVVASGPSYH